MTFSTGLTFLRMILAVVIIFLQFSSGVAARSGALAAFLIAGATDWLDGYLARRWHQTSDIGTLLDPIADKVLVLGILAALAIQQVVPAWIVWIIAGRELLITAVRLLAAKRKLVLAAAPEGKLKTFAQILSLLLFLIAGLWQAVAAQSSSANPPLIARLSQAAVSILIFAMTLTLFSGYLFFQRNAKALRSAILGR